MNAVDLRQHAAIEAMKAILKSGDRIDSDTVGKRAVACADSLLAALSENVSGRFEPWVWHNGERVSTSKLPLKDLSNFGTRVQTAFSNAGIVTVFDLSKMSRIEIMDIPGIGSSSRKQVFEFLHERGIYIAD